MFDCPPQEKQRLEWKADLPIESRAWNVGLIVGPSGCGKTTVAKHLWPREFEYAPDWHKPTVIDCFPSDVEETSKALNSVGFSTIPAWLRPYSVLSNGEKFRVDIARRMIEQKGIIVVDEFTSVVDRQVAKVASHATQKYVRKQNRQMIAVSCHYDIIDWLQPDWTFEPAEQRFTWRSLCRRPAVNIEVARIPYEAWRLFAPHHYMSAALNKAATCFGLWCDDVLACFAGVLHRPHAKSKNIKGLSRLVTLPDFQGLGLAFVLSETLGAAYKAVGQRFRNYPAHPAFVRSYRKETWLTVKRAGTYLSPQSSRRDPGNIKSFAATRPCATLEYIGAAMDKSLAERLLRGV